MPIISVEAMNASLANDYGPEHGPSSPDSFLLSIFTDDPRYGGEEFDLDVGGYTRVAVAHTDFDTPSEGKIKVIVQEPDATDAWTVAGDPAKGTWWALRDADTLDIWDADALDEPLVVPGAGTFDPMPVVIYHPELIDPEE